MNGVVFYPSKNNNALNAMPFEPERVNGRVMVNPHYPVVTLPGTRRVWDSGAFQERDMLNRLEPYQAFQRQISADEICMFRSGDYINPAEAIVTYDMLVGVDEALINGKRVKQRGSEETAKQAVYETLRSAQYYARQRHRIDERTAIAFAAQGATLKQYCDCVAEILPMMKPNDWLAFGGFCIIGKQPSLKKLFVQTFESVLLMMKKAGIKRGHVLGVTVADMVDFAAKMGRAHGIVISNDSSGIEVNSIMGKIFEPERYRLLDKYGENKFITPWIKVWSAEQKYSHYKPCKLAMENIERYHQWSSSL